MWFGEDSCPSHFSLYPATNSSMSGSHDSCLSAPQFCLGTSISLEDTSNYFDSTWSQNDFSSQGAGEIAEEYADRQETPEPKLLPTSLTNQDMSASKTASKTAKSPRSKRRRAVLTAEKASEIFFLKQIGSIWNNCLSPLANASDSVTVSRLFGISPKAVRDIWNG